MIWKTLASLEDLNRLNKDLLIDRLNISFTEMGADFLTAEMKIAPFHMQPFGIMHGGASCVLAETVASAAANLCVDQNLHYCVGLELNINHISAVKEGILQAKAEALHLGKKTQVWNILIRDTTKRLISASRLTVAVIEKKKPLIS